MTKILPPPSLSGERGRVRGSLDIWILGNWKLFGIWDLVIGI
jgi:hypothetical protein